jgi:hypothetical protein
MSPNPDAPFLEVDVLPPQMEQLQLSQACIGGETDQRLSPL